MEAEDEEVLRSSPIVAEKGHLHCTRRIALQDFGEKLTRWYGYGPYNQRLSSKEVETLKKTLSLETSSAS